MLTTEHTLRATLVDPEGVSHPAQARGQEAKGTQPSREVTTESCPSKQARLELRPPLQAQDNGQAGQALRPREEQEGAPCLKNSCQQIKTPLHGSVQGPHGLSRAWCLPDDVMEAQG